MLSKQKVFLTPRGGWSNSPNQAERFDSKAAAQKRLGRRGAEIVKYAFL